MRGAFLAVAADRGSAINRNSGQFAWVFNNKGFCVRFASEIGQNHTNNGLYVRMGKFQ